MQEYKVKMIDKEEKRAYRRSVTLLMEKAVYNLWNNQARVRVLHSLGEGYYCELDGLEVNKERLAELKQEMI